MVLGLTGGIASGKTLVEGFLCEMGVPVIDADMVSRALTAKDGAALPHIRQAFGECVFNADSTLNRAALGALIFADDDKRRQLEGILHPMITAHIVTWLNAQSAPVCVMSAPLLYEAGLDKMCDAVWVVACSRDMQIARCMARDGLSREDATRRVDSQMPLDEKVARGADIIWNEGNAEQLRSAIVEKYVHLQE